jgi:hypothetical protein
MTPPRHEMTSFSAGRSLPGDERRRVLAVVAALVLGVGLVFGRTVWFGFTGYDDPLYVTENPWVFAGLTPAGAAWALTTDRGSSWVPLTWLSLMLDAQLYGAWPGGYHLTNVLLHAATTGVFFLALSRMTGAPGRSAAAAVLFAVHPLRVESVAWIAERKDVLSVFFLTVSLLAYERYARRPTPAGYLAVAAAMLASLLAKATAVTLPVLLLVLDAVRGNVRGGAPTGQDSLLILVEP